MVMTSHHPTGVSVIHFSEAGLCSLRKPRCGGGPISPVEVGLFRLQGTRWDKGRQVTLPSPALVLTGLALTAEPEDPVNDIRERSQGN